MELEGKQISEEKVGTEVVKAFDVADYEIGDYAVLTLLNKKKDAELIGADGKNPVTIELYSPGSSQGVKALKNAGRGQQRRFFETARGKLDPKDADRAEKENVDKLVGFTRRINNFPIDPESLYGNPKLGFITKQVEAFIADDANF